MHIQNTFSRFFSLPPRCLEVWCCGSETKSMLTLPPPTTPTPPSPTSSPPSSPGTSANSFHSCRQLCAVAITVAVGGRKVFPPRQRPQGTAANRRVQQVYWLECEWEVTCYLNVECGGGGFVIYRNFDSRWIRLFVSATRTRNSSATHRWRNAASDFFGVFVTAHVCWWLLTGRLLSFNYLDIRIIPLKDDCFVCCAMQIWLNSNS